MDYRGQLAADAAAMLIKGSKDYFGKTDPVATGLVEELLSSQKGIIKVMRDLSAMKDRLIEEGVSPLPSASPIRALNTIMHDLEELYTDNYPAKQVAEIAEAEVLIGVKLADLLPDRISMHWDYSDIAAEKTHLTDRISDWMRGDTREHAPFTAYDREWDMVYPYLESLAKHKAVDVDDPDSDKLAAILRDEFLCSYEEHVLSQSWYPEWHDMAVSVVATDLVNDIQGRLDRKFGQGVFCLALDDAELYDIVDGIEVVLNLDDVVDSLDLCCDVFLGGRDEVAGEFSCNWLLTRATYDAESIVNPDVEIPEALDKSSLAWIAEQRGLSRDCFLKDLKEGDLGYDLRAEAYDAGSTYCTVTVLTRLTFDNYCKLLAAKMLGHDFVIGKNAVCGLYDRMNGAGGTLDIELPAGLKIPADRIHDIALEPIDRYGKGLISFLPNGWAGDRYGIQDAYGAPADWWRWDAVKVAAEAPVLPPGELRERSKAAVDAATQAPCPITPAHSAPKH